MRLFRTVVSTALLASLLVLGVADTAGAAPTVTSFSPGGGTISGDTQVSVGGTGFVAGSVVSLVELNPLTSAVENTIVGSSGTVNGAGTSISNANVPTTGQPPSFAGSPPFFTGDVSYFVRVTNPDGTTSTSSAEFNLLADSPKVTSINPSSVVRGRTTFIDLMGSNLARGATVAINNPSPPASGATFSNPKWKSLNTYEIAITVPADYPLGSRNITFTNTDGKSTTCTSCLTVTSAPATLVPNVKTVSPTFASNSSSNSARTLTIDGTDFSSPPNVEARLVGFCPGGGTCPMTGRTIPLTGVAVTQGSPPQLVDDELTGKVNLELAAPGKYSVVVQNIGSPSGTGSLAGGFEVLATGAPSVSSPTAGSPITIKAGETKDVVINGDNFAFGDAVSISGSGVSVTQVSVISKTTINATLKAASSVGGGRRALSVTHTNGNTGSCSNCVAVAGGDLHDLLWLDGSGGADSLWRSNGNGTFSAFPASVPNGSQAIVGRFNGDGLDDVLAYRPGSASDAMLLANNAGFTTVGASVRGTYQPITGHFAGSDELTDILWYRPGSGSDFLWKSDGDGTFSSTGQSISGTYEPLAFDADADGDTDILWYRPGSGSDYFWLSDGAGGFSSFAVSITGTYQVLLGNFLGSPGTDLFFYAPGSRPDYIWTHTGGGSFTSVRRSVGGTYVPIVGDYTTDGFSDVLWYRAGGGADYLWVNNGAGSFSSVRQSITGTYTPSVGSFVAGGGADDILWNSTGSRDYIWASNGNGKTFSSFRITQASTTKVAVGRFITSP